MSTALSPLEGELTVARMLDASTLRGSRVLAGSEGLGRRVLRLNVMEVPDILPWVKPHEFLLTTAYPLREVPGKLAGLVDDLDERGLAGLGIKVGRYLEAIPSDMLERADERGFPLVQLPDGIGFDDILNQVLTDILNRQAALLTRSEETHRALLDVVLTGGGLPDVTRVLAQLLTTPVAVTDVQGSVLAAARLDPVRLRLREAGLLDGRDVFRVPDEHREATGGPVISVPVHAGTRLHGHLLAVEDGRPLDGRDLLALRNAATVAGLVVTKEEAVAAVEGKYASDFLHDLLDGRVSDESDAVTRSAALGWDVTGELVVMIVSPAGADSSVQRDRAAGPDLLSRLAAGVRAVLLPRDPTAALAAFSGEVVLLTKPTSGAADRRHAAKRLASYLAAEAVRHAGVPVAVGISRVVQGPGEIADAYRQADRALRIGRETEGDTAVSHFDDLGVFRLLSLIEDRSELEAYAAETLGPLASDDAEAVELRRTLTVLLAENLNVAASARRLHFHYNTLRYRLDKLERMLGPFTSDERLRLDLQVALRVLHLRTLRR